jgi:cytochrome c553
MSKANRFITVLLLICSILVAGLAFSDNLRSHADATQADVATRTDPEAAFDKMMAVLTHKRCLNCHPADDYPRQGEDSHIHNFGVQRGPDNHGVAALQCKSCHQHENNNLSGVPGAPEWSLAPKKMAWRGLSRVEIAQSMLNPENNGGRSLEETVKHLTEHELVLWAWEPGVDANGTPREKPPVSKEDYIKAVKEWAAAGAPIPEK